MDPSKLRVTAFYSPSPHPTERKNWTFNFSHILRRFVLPCFFCAFSWRKVDRRAENNWTKIFCLFSILEYFESFTFLADCSTKMKKENFQFSHYLFSDGKLLKYEILEGVRKGHNKIIEIFSRQTFIFILFETFPVTNNLNFPRFILWNFIFPVFLSYPLFPLFTTRII